MNKYYGVAYEEFADFQSRLNLKDFEVTDKEKFYHYASVDAALNILKHKNQKYTMWASHLDFLNDREEFVNGEKLIIRELSSFINTKLDSGRNDDNLRFKDCVTKFINAVRNSDKNVYIDEKLVFDRNIYIICFCLEKNSLNQWKYYGKESGIALEFGLHDCAYTNLCVNDLSKEINIHPRRVVYDNKEKKEILSKLITQIYKDFLAKENVDRERNIYDYLASLYSLCPLFKHPDFKDEKECRLLFRPIYQKEGKNKDKDVRELIHYRKRGDILLPYMKVDMQSANDEPLIKSIIIGPRENQNLLYKSIVHFALNNGVFDKYGMGKDGKEIIKKYVKKSKTPFRS